MQKLSKALRSLKVAALVVVLAGAGFFTSAGMSAASPKPTYEQNARLSVGSLFHGNDFHCSGTVIGENASHEALFLTARHCVVDESGALLNGLSVSFTDDQLGPYYLATIDLVSKTEDLALLDLVNSQGLPQVSLGDENKLVAGDRIVDISFVLDAGKLSIYGEFVAPFFPHLPDELAMFRPEWFYSMPVNLTGGPGASGSGIFDPKQKALIGVLVGGYSGSGGSSTFTIVEPVSRVVYLLEHAKENSAKNWGQK